MIDYCVDGTYHGTSATMVIDLHQICSAPAQRIVIKTMNENGYGGLLAPFPSPCRLFCLFPQQKNLERTSL